MGEKKNERKKIVEGGKKDIRVKKRGESQEKQEGKREGSRNAVTPRKLCRVPSSLLATNLGSPQCRL